MIARTVGRKALGAGLASLALIAGAQADPIADFYRGRQMFFVQGGAEGGGYSAYARAFAPYLEKHIPGNPKIVVQSLPGAGGMRLMQNLSAQAPRDGSYIGLVQSGVAFAPLMGSGGATFDARKMNWIGAMSRVPAICAAMPNSGIATFQDLLDKTFIVGSSGAGSLTEMQPALLNKFYGTKIKIVSGYPGGNDIHLAMERGEVQGRCGTGAPSFELARPGWISKGQLKIPIQFAIARSKDLPDVPTAFELAKNDQVRAVMKLVLAPVEMNRTLVAPPDMPRERVAALRAAFHAGIADPDFLADAAKQRLEIAENSGERIAEIINEAYAMPADIIALAKSAMKESQGGN